MINIWTSCADVSRTAIHAGIQNIKASCLCNTFIPIVRRSTFLDNVRFGPSLLRSENLKTTSVKSTETLTFITFRPCSDRVNLLSIDASISARPRILKSLSDQPRPHSRAVPTSRTTRTAENASHTPFHRTSMPSPYVYHLSVKLVYVCRSATSLLCCLLVIVRGK